MPPGVADDPDGVGGGAPAAQLPPTPVGALAALGAGGQQVSGGAAHSASTSGGSAGSPSSRSEQHAPDGAAKGAAPGAAAAAAAAASTPASESTFLRLNNLDINGDDAPSSQAPTRLVCPNGLCCQLRHPAAAAAAAAVCHSVFRYKLVEIGYSHHDEVPNACSQSRICPLFELLC
jgi:hypothetical protein